MYCVFIFFQFKYFLITLDFFFDSWVKKCVILFSNIWEFWDIFFLLISVVIYFWSQNILCTTWVLLNLLRLVLWPRIGTILVNDLCAWNNNVCSGQFGGGNKNYLKIVSWDNHGAYVYFLSLRDGCTMLPNIQCLENNCFIYFVYFINCVR